MDAGLTYTWLRRVRRMERIGKAISQLKLSALFRIEKSLKRMMKSGGKALLTPI